MTSDEGAAPAPVRVLITGSRDFTSRPIVAAALSWVSKEYPGRPLIVVHGGARGADSIAGQVARDYPGRLVEEVHRVTDWRRPDGSTDKAAGHRRNQRMVDLGAVVCLAFPCKAAENRGTLGCIQKAKAAGIPVHEFWD